MKKYNISINIEDANKSNKSFLFHTSSTDLRPEQVIALLDVLEKNVKTELIETIKLDTCKYYVDGRCKGSKGFEQVDCKGIEDNCIYI